MALKEINPRRRVYMQARSELSTNKREELEALFCKYGYTDFKWIEPDKIVVSHWVRMKCMFGCGEYGKTASCPPNVPLVSECERFFREYNDAVIFHFEKKVAKPEDRFAWTKKVNAKLSKLEREVFLSGYERAFLLFMDSCRICGECEAGVRENCKQPRLARPSPEALAIDVYATVRQVDYPIHVLPDYSQKMNRYAFLMIK
jgi:predicted metal-binding protein